MKVYHNGNWSMRIIACFAINIALFSLAKAEMNKIVFLGDSLTAGYGLEVEAAYPSLVQQMLQDKGLSVSVVNAGVSGDTSAGGLARLPWILKQPIDLLVIALGANDALRGLPPENTRENLASMIDLAREKQPKIQIILAGMIAPPNMGFSYRRAFDGIYSDLAKKKRVKLYPFLLEGVAADPSLNLADGIHPNRKGQRIMARQLADFIQEALD